MLIVWNSALKYLERIRPHITENFKILKQYDIYWDEDRFGENLTSFYEEDFRLNSTHITDRGVGVFRVFVIYDSSPEYQMMHTRRGMELVNLNMHRLKEKIRNRITHTYNFHASVNENETRSNLIKLLGITLDEFLTENMNINKDICVIKRNCTGVLGWCSLRELFRVLNESCKYVVLRTFDALPDNHRMEIHGDIDILVQDLPAFLNILTPQKEYGDNAYRFFNWLIIGDQKILIHAKFVGDHYYDTTWEQRILDTRFKNNNGIYIPNTEMYFWTLLYHGIFHKENYLKYESIFKNLSLQLLGKVWQNDKEYLCNLLSDWLIDNHYECQLHLDGDAGVLQTQNFRKGIQAKQTPVIYAYYQDIQGEHYNVTYISENLIRVNGKLFTSIVRPLDSLLCLQKNVLRNDTQLYHDLTTREQMGEFLWKYSIRLDDISEMVYIHEKENLSYFRKRFVSGRAKIENTDIECHEEPYIPFKSGILVSDRMKWIALIKGEDFLKKELYIFAKEVFKEYATDDETLLQPLAWDAVPKNCFYTDTGQYYFFDLEIHAKFPLKKEFVLAQIVRQACQEVAYDKQKTNDIFSQISEQFGMTGLDFYTYCAGFDKQVFELIKTHAVRNSIVYQYYFLSPFMYNKLITVSLENLIRRDEHMQNICSQLREMNEIKKKYQEIKERLATSETKNKICQMELTAVREDYKIYRRKLEELQNSTSCKLGFSLTFVFRKLKNYWKR